MRKYIFFYLILHSFYGFSQQRDTIRLIIEKEVKKAPDTVFLFSRHVDTIALQPIITDTSKVVKDINPQDLETSKYMIKLMGSVRVNSYYDFKGMESSDGFLPYDIPIGEEEIKNLSSVYIGARQTRLGIEGTANTKVGQLKSYIEVDFASSGSSIWRLRHAYAEWNYFKLGYTWSTFMDNASLPNTVDFEGPNSALVKRHGVIRYEKKFGLKSIIGVSLESPESDYYNPEDSLINQKNIQDNFDVVLRYKQYNDSRHFQVAGMWRRISYIEQKEMSTLYGWGILLSSAMRLSQKQKLYVQYSFGKGIAHYFVGFGDRQLDAVYDSNSQTMRLKSINGGFVSYNYNAFSKYNFSITYGLSFVKNYSFEPSTAFSSSQYLATNIFYAPIETISLGLEITTGSRKNYDKETGVATRISFMAKFDF